MAETQESPARLAKGRKPRASDQAADFEEFSFATGSFFDTGRNQANRDCICCICWRMTTRAFCASAGTPAGIEGASNKDAGAALPLVNRSSHSAFCLSH